jgi:hypothetical protein
MQPFSLRTAAMAVVCTIAIAALPSPAAANPACVTISNLRLTSQSTTIIELGGTAPCSGYDVVHVTNQAELYGTLRLELINGFTPQPLDSFTIVTWGTRLGTPTITRGTSFPLPAGMTLTPAFLPNELAIRMGARPGDANLDAAVNFDDLLALASNYNAQSGRIWARGDFNRDGVTNFDDLLLLAANYNSLAGSAGGGTGFALALAPSIPEPAGLLAPLIAAAALCRGSRRTPTSQR